MDKIGQNGRFEPYSERFVSLQMVSLIEASSHKVDRNDGFRPVYIGLRDRDRFILYPHPPSQFNSSNASSRDNKNPD